MYNPSALQDVIGCDSDFRIARDGGWYYQGSPVGRQAMVRLFSTILHRAEDGEYWLKTPGEQCRIVVEDVPFIVIDHRWRDMAGKGRCLCLKTNVNEWVTVDGSHPLMIQRDPASGESLLYVHVRDGLDARLNRATSYAVMDEALTQGETRNGLHGIVSAGCFFAVEEKP